MRQYYQPVIQNGRIPRRAIRSGIPARAISPGIRHKRNRHNEPGEVVQAITPGLVTSSVRKNQSTIAMTMLIIGSLLIAASFVFGLHQHFTAAVISQQDAQLRLTMQKAETEQTWLSVERARERSPQRLMERISGTGMASVALEKKVSPRR